MNGLGLNAPPVGPASAYGARRLDFTTPALIPTLPGEPRRFRDLAALGRHVQRLRGRRGLQIKRMAATYMGSPTFIGFELHALYEGCDQGEYLGFAYAPGVDRREAFEAVLREADPAEAPAAGESRLVLA
jgi:hypothetical protein